MVVVSGASRLPRYVGAAFVVQFVTSLAAGVLTGSILGSSAADLLGAVRADPLRLRVTVLLELATALTIVVLSCLLYELLRDLGRPTALVALVLWVLEALLLAASMTGVLTLLDLAGSAAGPDPGAVTLAKGWHEHLGDLDMLFFSTGALLWYWLLLKARILPTWLPVWGLAGVVFVLVATVLAIWDRDLETVALYVLYIPFELVLGLWLLARGAVPRDRPAAPPADRHVTAGR